MAKATKSLSKTAVWILLGLLFIGLAGFGADGLTGNIRTIGNVGDKYIDVNAYANQLQQASTSACLPVSFKPARLTMKRRGWACPSGMSVCEKSC